VAAPRPAAQRKADTLAKLREREVDGWVATSGDDGAYLVPLSLAWIGERVVLALEPSSRTARNLRESRHARLGLGPTRDVVLIDAEVEALQLAGEVDEEIAVAYADQARWDPRKESVPFVYVALRPRRMQVWREANELSGRTLMKDGVWLV